jgi:hypothetical protein
MTVFSSPQHAANLVDGLTGIVIESDWAFHRKQAFYQKQASRPPPTHTHKQRHPFSKRSTAHAPPHPRSLSVPGSTRAACCMDGKRCTAADGAGRGAAASGDMRGGAAGGGPPPAGLSTLLHMPALPMALLLPGIPWGTNGGPLAAEDKCCSCCHAGCNC